MGCRYRPLTVLVSKTIVVLAFCQPADLNYPATCGGGAPKSSLCSIQPVENSGSLMRIVLNCRKAMMVDVALLKP